MAVSVKDVEYLHLRYEPPFSLVIMPVFYTGKQRSPHAPSAGTCPAAALAPTDTRRSSGRDSEDRAPAWRDRTTHRQHAVSDAPPAHPAPDAGSPGAAGPAPAHQSFLPASAGQPLSCPG